MSTRNITRKQTVAIATNLAAAYGVPFTDGHFVSFEPTVIEGAHEESSSAWIVSWEDSPAAEWAWSTTLANATRNATGGTFYAEAINSWSVGFYAV